MGISKTLLMKKILNTIWSIVNGARNRMAAIYPHKTETSDQDNCHRFVKVLVYSLRLDNGK